jgi:Mrp family chromosome partitioning ATPase
MLLVTSAVPREGKSTVAAQLALALAATGDRTLVVSADLRQPMVHELLDVPILPGLTDVLAGLQVPKVNEQRLVEQSIRNVDEPGGRLDVLPSGRPQGDPAEILSAATVARAFDAIRKLDYTYVLVDAPALLGIADSHVLARCCDAILYVAKLDRVTVDNCVDARDVLDRLDVRTVGAVIVGARGEPSAYYIGERAPAYDDV